MNRAMKDRKAYWIGGTATAFVGVALVRLLSPELAGIHHWVAVATGYALVIAGITVLGCATRRKKSEAFIKVGTDAKD